MTTFTKNVGQALAAFAVAAALWEWGYSVGGGKDDALIRLLEEQNRQYSAKATDLTKENENLRLQLLGASRGPTADSPGDSQPAPTQPVQSTPTAKPSTPGALTASTVTIRQGQSAVLFDGQVAISLVGTEYSGDPLRHKVYAVVGSAGGKNVEFKAVDVGHTVQFGNYEVRVVSAGTFDAAFRVTPLQKP